MLKPEFAPATKCPVCSSGQVRTSHELSPQQAAQHFVRREGNLKRNQDLASHISLLWGGRKCFIRQCTECAFGYSDPYVAGDMTFYDLAYERSGYSSEKWEFQRSVNELSANHIRARRVLEVGAGAGFFLDKIVDVYVPRSGITALEYSERALKILRSKKYFALQEDLRTADLSDGFDAIFLFQVLEHLDNLDSLFERFSQLLLDNGLLFIAVPNAIRIQFNEENGSLLDMPPNHIGRWSPAAFKTIGSRYGLHLKQCEIEPFSLGEFVKQDIVCSYLRRSQRAGTLENWSRAVRSARYGKLAGAAVAALTAPRRLGVWRKAAGVGNLGESLWVKFTKGGV